MNNKDIKRELENSEHFQDMIFTPSSVESITKKIYLRNFTRDIFIGLFTFFLFFIYLVTIHNVFFARYVPELIRFIIVIAIIVLFFLVAKRMAHWIQTLRYSFVLQLILNGLLVLYFVYQGFAPYFFTDDYLIEHGIEKIELSYQVDDIGLTMEERKDLASEAYVRLMAYSNISRMELPDYIPTNSELIDFKFIEIHRSFNQYELLVEVTEKIDNESFTSKVSFTFEKEMGEFKLSGWYQSIL